MRLIGSIPLLAKARLFSQFLEREGIHNECEPTQGKDEGIIWILNEDDVPKSLQWLEKFKGNPDDPFFETPIGATLSLSEDVISPETAPRIRKSQKKATFITFLLVLCAFIYIFTEWTAPPLPENVEEIKYPNAYMPKLMNDLLYDFPKAYTLQVELVQNPPANPEPLMREIAAMPYWKGAYAEFIERYKDPSLGWSYKGPMFEKIQQGEVWRLITPILMHGNLLHILFNAMWIIVLGVQMERKIGHLKTIVFVLITGIISNTAEYLMTGPNFLGLSGVVVAMCGFIWIRQKKAPWEGYLLHSSTFLFIAIFVLGMALIELISFFSLLFADRALSPGIANTAHIVGGLAGILLGSMKIFARKASRPYH